MTLIYSTGYRSCDGVSMRSYAELQYRVLRHTHKKEQAARLAMHENKYFINIAASINVVPYAFLEIVDLDLSNILR